MIVFSWTVISDSTAKVKRLKVLLHILSVVNILNIAYSPRPMSYLL